MNTRLRRVIGGKILPARVEVALTGIVNIGTLAGTTWTDIPGASLAVPASSTPVLLRFKGEAAHVTGTSATVGNNCNLQVGIVDSGGNVLALDGFNGVQVTVANRSVQGKVEVEFELPAPVAAGTYKLQCRVQPSLPTGWTAELLPGLSGVTSPKNIFSATPLLS